LSKLFRVIKKESNIFQKQLQDAAVGSWFRDELSILWLKDVRFFAAVFVSITYRSIPVIFQSHPSQSPSMAPAMVRSSMLLF